MQKEQSVLTIPEIYATQNLEINKQGAQIRKGGGPSGRGDYYLELDSSLVKFKLNLILVSPVNFLPIFRVSVLKNKSEKLFLYCKIYFCRIRRNLVLVSLKIRKKQRKISTEIDMQMH